MTAAPFSRIGLIAGREFRAYASSASFWIALAIAPVGMAVAVLAMNAGPKTSRAEAVLLYAPAETLARTAEGAVAGAYSIDGVAPPRFVRVAAADKAQIAVVAGRAGGWELKGREGLALSPAGKALVEATFERDALRGVPSEPANPRPAAETPDRAANLAEARALIDHAGRVSLAVVLWLALTGSLGMLLQAIVRERANKALETLLAAVRPIEIVAGKLVGVGAVSGLVVGTWLMSALGLAAATHAATGLAADVLRAAAQPMLLAEAAGLYLAAFLLFGFATIAVGATARDVAEAQNLSRPMFALLLAVFFVAMNSGPGAPLLQGFLFLPPFAPFLILVQNPPFGAVLGSLAPLLGAIVLAARISARRVQLDAPRPRKSGFPLRFMQTRA
jgi:hypothetical protein